MNENSRQPPPIVTALLERCLPAATRDAMIGDLAEEYGRRTVLQSRAATNRWYYKEAFMILMHALTARLPRVCTAIALNVASLAIFWLVGFAASYLLGAVIPTGAILSVATALGILVAVRLHAHAAAFFLAAMLAFLLAELVAHTAWGYRVVQGAQTHFTVLGAGILGVAFGALLVRYLSSRTGHESSTRDDRRITAAGVVAPEPRTSL